MTSKFKIWHDAILTAPLDLTVLDDLCEEMANDENISNTEYCELYAVALGKIQEANT